MKHQIRYNPFPVSVFRFLLFCLVTLAFVVYLASIGFYTTSSSLSRSVSCADHKQILRLLNNTSSTKKQQQQHFDTHCAVQDLGCFEPSDALHDEVITKKINPISSQQCFSYCDSNNKSFAGMTQGRLCACANDVNYFVNITRSSSECDIKCKNDTSTNCGGLRNYRVNRLLSPCVTGKYTPEYVKTRSLGCFQANPVHSGFESRPVWLPTECFSECTRLRHPVAAFGMWFGCLCGQMSNRFNLTNSSACEDIQSGKVYRTLVEDKRCSNIRLLPPRPRKQTVLLSFPGSGNTWVRYLLEKATGVYTGSKYKDIALHQTGFLGELLPDFLRTGILKCHNKVPPVHWVGEGSSIILLIRNPFDATVADFNRYKSANKDHTGSVPKEVYDEYFSKYITLRGDKWVTIVTSAIASKQPLLVIFYEDVVKKPIREVKRMVKFLPSKDLKPDDLHDRLACLSQETTGFQKREKRVLHFDPFTAEETKLFYSRIKKLRKILATIKVKLPDYTSKFKKS